MVIFAAHNYTNITSDQTNQDFTFGRTAQGSVSFKSTLASNQIMGAKLHSPSASVHGCSRCIQ